VDSDEVRAHHPKHQCLIETPLTSSTAFIWTTTKLRIRKRTSPELESVTDSVHTDFSSYHDTESEYEETLVRSETSSFSGEDEKGFEESKHPLARSTRFIKNSASLVPAWASTTGFLAFLAITLICRPLTPYVHMSTTLPVPLMNIYKPSTDECGSRTRLASHSWPIPDLVAADKWEKPKGYFKGWAPSHDNKYIKQYRERTPEWLPAEPLPGFHRWYPSQRSNVTVADLEEDGATPSNQEKIDSKCPNVLVQDDDYNPVDDPLKISNLDQELLQPLRQALKDSKVKITHVALIQMESMREELFPIQQGSWVHKMILDSHPESEREEANLKLSRLTPNAEKITGRLGGFTDVNGKPYEKIEPEWKYEPKPGMGGINVIGGLTPASFSTKSVVASHCGVWPMPVDFLEEAESQSYQPCFPQLFDLFNANRDNSSDTSKVENRPWEQMFFQAVTAGYDRQNVLNEHMGFKQVVEKKRLEEDSKTDPSIKEINYFGYPEPNLKRYMKDFITNATQDEQRMFFSHFTSTTHHPWETPEWWNSTSYMGRESLHNHEPFDKYLNTIRFHDAWLGEMLQMFDDLGVSDETLFVFVGDHGQAFKEDYSKTGTYENGHVSNFRVPISLHHRNLPRVQYSANASSISIIPTVLDLLIETGNLDKKDTAAASDLIQDYEGQSLLRPYKTSHHGRRAWHFGIVNSGGGILTVSSADTPYRLVMPLEKEFEYMFTDTERDPQETNALSKWSIEQLIRAVQRMHGDEAASWVDEAELVAKWWVQERKRLWKHAPSDFESDDKDGK
jgi:arylsulfatase A-like enzyme